MNPSLLLAIVAVLAPAAVALLLAAASPLRRLGWPAAVLCIAASLAATAASIALVVGQLGGAAPGQWTVPWLGSGSHMFAEVGFRIDGVSAPMLAVVSFVALCVQLFSVGYMHEETPGGFGRYFAFHALFLFSMNLLVAAPNLLQLFVGWELVGVTSYLLIGFWYQKPSAARAAVKAFWVTKFADMGFMVALFVLFAATGAFRWDAPLAPAVATAVTGLLFLAVVGKSAQFPLHVWLPDAMEGPTPVSALLHAATMVAAGVFLVVRANPLFAQSEATRTVMIVIGVTTALFAAALALVQRDIKKVLAYSTCSQLGYMVAALGAGSMLGGFFHLTTHAFFKALLFLAAGSVIHAVHSNNLDEMGGLRRRMPITTASFIIGALALAGIPGLSGFFSKDLVLASVEDKLGGLPWAALLLTAFLTAFYMARVIAMAFFGEPTERAAHAHESGRSMTVPLVLLSLLALGAGYLAPPFARLAGEPYHLHLLATTPIAASLAGIIGLVAGFRVYAGGDVAHPVARAITRLSDTAAFDRLYELAYRRVVLALAAVLGWFDRYVVDGVMNFIGWAFIKTGRAMRPAQTGLATDYVMAVVLGAVGLAIWGIWG